MCFLNDLPSFVAKKQPSSSLVFSAATAPDAYLDALKCLLAKSLQSVAGVLSQCLADGGDPLDGWNANLDDLLVCSRLHTFLVLIACLLLLLSCFVELSSLWNL
jgi:hypothetical protein